MTSPTGTSGSPTADAPQHLLGRFPTYAGAERLELSDQLAAATVAVDRVEVRADQAGIIDKLHVNTVGSAIEPYDSKSVGKFAVEGPDIDITSAQRPRRGSGPLPL